MKYVINTFLLILVIFSSSQCFALGDDIPKEFKKLLERGKLNFEPPHNMKMVDVSKDTFDIAYLDEKTNFELRIKIFPLDSTDKPNEKFEFLSLVDEGTYESIDMTPDKFNAEKAAVADFKFIDTYSGYKKGSMFWFYKKKYASVWIFYLGGDSKNFGQWVINHLFLLNFKE
jgi:hypothetical protein